MRSVGFCQMRFQLLDKVADLWIATRDYCLTTRVQAAYYARTAQMFDAA